MANDFISISDLLPQILEGYQRKHDNEDLYRSAVTPWEKRRSMAKIYQAISPEIIARGGRWDPYSFPWDWDEWFTPIEREAWHAIRGQGVPLLPQYPILRYFADFANPAWRVALELDGREWHQDNARDRLRDEAIVQAGWHIYRVAGAETMPMTTREEGREFYQQTCWGVILALDHVYGRGCCSEEELGWSYQTLDAHRLVDFSIGNDERSS